MLHLYHNKGAVFVIGVFIWIITHLFVTLHPKSDKGIG